MWYIIRNKDHKILYTSRHWEKTRRRCERLEREGFKDYYTEWRDDDKTGI